MQVAPAPGYNAYFRLMRLHQPTGIWLLLWPCWWSVTLASQGFPSPYLLLLFFIGAFLMRPAGCIVNDIADRHLDKQVERTKTRPLASGEITVPQAVRLLLWLLMLAFAAAFALGEKVALWAALSLPLVFLYPWMKRLTWWPQLFLGLTFNWGALLGWVAVRGTVDLSAVMLYAGGVFWTLGYDTIYAHQDKEGDARAGVKSTALKLGGQTKTALLAFYALAILCWCYGGYAIGANPLFYGLMLVAWLQLVWQVRTVNLDSPDSCREIFMSNTGIGWLVFAAILGGK